MCAKINQRVRRSQKQGERYCDNTITNSVLYLDRLLRKLHIIWEFCLISLL